MQATFVVLRGLALLLLEPYNLTLFQLILAMTLVIFGYLAIADAYLLAYRLEGIAATGYGPETRT